jgi:hypothetical protein
MTIHLPPRKAVSPHQERVETEIEARLGSSWNGFSGYRRLDEPSNMCCRRELPEGEGVESGTLTSAGQEVSRSVLKRDDKVMLRIPRSSVY